MILQIDITTAAIFFIIGFIAGAAVALWNVAAKYASSTDRRRGE